MDGFLGDAMFVDPEHLLVVGEEGTVLSLPL